MRIDSSHSMKPMGDFPIDKQDLNEIKGYINMIKDQAKDGDYKDALSSLGNLEGKLDDLQMKGNLNLGRHQSDLDTGYTQINSSLNALARGTKDPQSELSAINSWSDYIYGIAKQS